MAQFVELLLEIGFLNHDLALGRQPNDLPAPVATAAAAAPAACAAPPAQSGGGVEAEVLAGRGRGGGSEGPRRRGRGQDQGAGARSVSGMAAVKAIMRHRPIGGAHYNVHSDSLPCLRAVLCAGLYPNVVKAEEDPEGRRTPRLAGAGGATVALHPSTVNADVIRFQSRWLVFYEKVRVTRRSCGI